MKSNENYAAVGFMGMMVAAGTRGLFSARAQTPFKGTHLHIPYAIAKHFEIRDIRVGKNSMLIGPGPIPADLFSLQFKDDEILSGRSFNFDTAQISQDIHLEVFNIKVTSHYFAACIHGVIPSAIDERVVPCYSCDGIDKHGAGCPLYVPDK